MTPEVKPLTVSHQYDHLISKLNKNKGTGTINSDFSFVDERNFRRHHGIKLSEGQQAELRTRFKRLQKLLKKAAAPVQAQLPKGNTKFVKITDELQELQNITRGDRSRSERRPSIGATNATLRGVLEGVSQQLAASQEHRPTPVISSGSGADWEVSRRENSLGSFEKGVPTADENLLSKSSSAVKAAHLEPRHSFDNQHEPLEHRYNTLDSPGMAALLALDRHLESVTGPHYDRRNSNLTSQKSTIRTQSCLWKGESQERSLDMQADAPALSTLEEAVDLHLLIMGYIKEHELLTPDLESCLNELT